MVNYIKYNINTNITVGFVFGKEFIANNQSKTLMSDLKKTLLELADLEKEDTIFFIADSEKRATELAGQIRTELAERLDLIEKDVFKFCHSHRRRRPCSPKRDGCRTER